MQLSHIFEILSISNEIPSISIKIPNISIENLGLVEVLLEVFRSRNFEILAFPHLEVEI